MELAAPRLPISLFGIKGLPKTRTGHPYLRGLLVGFACGALIGLAMFTFGDAWTEFSLRARLVGASAFGVLGGLAGGFVSRTGWITVAGAMIGWIIVGILCALAVRHAKGVMYGILPGSLLGGYAGYVLGTRWESTMGRSRKDPVTVPSAGMWDREVDG